MSRSAHTPRSYSENVNDQLRAYGASTMGDYNRRVQRLQRFIAADKAKAHATMLHNEKRRLAEFMENARNTPATRSRVILVDTILSYIR